MAGVLALGLLLMGSVYAGSPAGDHPYTGDRGHAGEAEAPVPAQSEVRAELAELATRVERLSQGWARLSAFYEAEVAPIERVLLRYSDDRELVGHVATALVREARAAGIEPRLLLAVLLVENPWLDPKVRSFVGAVGLMQVMPVHRGGWSCGRDLEDVDTNVCLGARVFAHYLDRADGDMEKALLRYNGCVTGSNTPNCHLYPSRVLAHAGRVAAAPTPGQVPSASP
ncbi:MAG: transglycosylase SLT domain-containing protein [Gemmatimonadota bacterium]